jgi:peroxiredoxin Q/BCP
MSFKRSSLDNDNDNGGGSDSGGDGQPFHKRQRFDDGRGRGRGGRGRGGRGDGFRGGRGGGGFRGGRGGFNKFNNDDNDGGSDRRGRGGFRDNRGGGGFRGRGGGRGRGGNRFDGERGRGRGRGDFRGGRGGRGGFRGDRPFNDNASIIKVQQDAPDFQNISNEKSENISLKQYRGKYVVLFIYFRDNTYGCSAEQKSFRDLKSQFDKLNAVILGVSRDNVETHKAAAAEANLNFSLLADTDGKISKSYGALDDTDRVTRCTFIIGPDGKVAAVWGKVFGFTEHAQQVLDKLKEITSGGQETKGDNNDNDNDNDNDVNQNDDNEANQNDDDDDDDDEDNDNDNDNGNNNNDDDDDDDGDDDDE